MPKIIVRNWSVFKVTNEFKIGTNANGFFDESLSHLGRFTLGPKESQEVNSVTETVDVYWKNIYENNWTHKTAWEFDDVVELPASTSVESVEEVDICTYGREFDKKEEDQKDHLVHAFDDSASFIAGKTLRYSVPPGGRSTQFPHFGQTTIKFSTNTSGGADFYLHVEKDNPERSRLYQGQALIFADGRSGLGPYILSATSIRKIHITNGTHGTVNVDATESA